MRILLSGGAGYLGCRVASQLLEAGSEVVVIDKLLFGGEGLLGLLDHPRYRLVAADVRDDEAVRQALAGVGAVVHLAALVGDQACQVNPRAAVEINHEATRRLLQLSVNAGVERFLLASTCSSYGISAGQGLASEDTPLRPLSLYAESKVQAEKEVLQATALAAAVLRLATLCGLSPRMRFDLLLNDMARRCALREPISLYAADAWRPLLHVRDAARAIQHCLLAPAAVIAGQVYNVVGANYQKRQLGELARKHFPATEVVVTEAVPDARDYRVSAERIARKLTFMPEHSIEQAFLEVAGAVARGLFADSNRPIYTAPPTATSLAPSGVKPTVQGSRIAQAGKLKGRVSVFGLGKVGLSLAVCLAEAGHRVLGFDSNPELVKAILGDQLSVEEPGVALRLAHSRGRTFSVTTDAVQASHETDLTFMIVPTPSNTLGGFSLRHVKQACAALALGLRKKSGRHALAVVSTMLPGSSELILLPWLEKLTGRKVGDSLGYCYNPAFIALGDVVKGFVEPDYVLIGAADEQTGNQVLAAHQAMIRNSVPIARMSPTEAEITKIASNTHETMRVAFANMLLALCNEIPGTDVDRITGALAHRMGKRFFKGAVPYGGPCWPRDNLALSVFMDTIGVPSTMPRTVDQLNQEHGRYVLRKVLSMTAGRQTVGIIGLAYKPGTRVIEAAFGVNLARCLAQEGRQVNAWDPLALEDARGQLGPAVCFAGSAAECIRNSQVVVLVNPLPELLQLDWRALGNRIVVDCWRCLGPAQTAHIEDYRSLGRLPAVAHRSLADLIDVERLRLLAE